jgi:hypothetical protein
LCHQVEADYVANYQTVVLLRIRSVGIVAFEDMTDGKKAHPSTSIEAAMLS